MYEDSWFEVNEGAMDEEELLDSGKSARETSLFVSWLYWGHVAIAPMSKNTILSNIKQGEISLTSSIAS